jgi:hypothetical protein
VPGLVQEVARKRELGLVDAQRAELDPDAGQESLVGDQLGGLDPDADIAQERGDPLGDQSAATASSTGVSPLTTTNVLWIELGSPSEAASTRATSSRGTSP